MAITSFTINDIETAVSADLISLEDGKKLADALFGINQPEAQPVDENGNPIPKTEPKLQDFVDQPARTGNPDQPTDDRPAEYQDQPQGDI